MAESTTGRPAPPWWYELDLYRRLMGAHLRGQMQYKRSFALTLFGNFAGNGLALLVLAITFSRFGTLAGWSFGEVALLYGIAAVAFGIQEMITEGGFDNLASLVREGTFDRVLLRPVTSFTQMLAADFQLRRLGRALQGGIALALALTTVHVEWTWTKLLYLPVAVMSGALFFSGVTVLGATLTFWTIERSEIINVFTYGGEFASSYPITIFSGGVQRFLTFVFPIAFVAYYPGLYLLDRPDPLGLPRWLPLLSPFVASAFFVLAWRVWEWGVRHYQSTGN